MRLICDASALVIRSLPEIHPSTDTGRRVIKHQVIDSYGESHDEDWLYIDAPAGRGWVWRDWLDLVEDERDTSVAWPTVPHGRDRIYDTFGSPGSEVCSAGRAKLPHPLLIGWTEEKYLKEFACHKLLEDVFTSVFRQISERGYWLHLDTFDGCFNDRTITYSQKISVHAWGIGVDLNASTNKLGLSPTMHPKIVAIFQDHGFTWGGDWNRPDGMHFQYARGY